jgi:hypothetical protein
MSRKINRLLKSISTTMLLQLHQNNSWQDTTQDTALPLETGKLDMALVVRIIGLSLLIAVLGAGLGFVLTGQSPDWPGISLILGCVGGMIGAIAGVGREIVTALHERRSS